MAGPTPILAMVGEGMLLGAAQQSWSQLQPRGALSRHILSPQTRGLGNLLQNQDQGISTGSCTLYTNSSIFSMAW